MERTASLNIITRAQADRSTAKQLQPLALLTIEHKNTITLVIKQFNGTFDELDAHTFWIGDLNRQIDYITYPDYVRNCETLEQYAKAVKKDLEEKVFSLEELNQIADYQDAKNKTSFILNILPQYFESKSVFGDGEKYPHKALLHTFARLQDAEELKRIYKEHRSEYLEKVVEDDAFFRSACVYEMYNHESPIDWDGFEPALNAIGVSFKALSKHRQEIVLDAYKEVCHGCEW